MRVEWFWVEQVLVSRDAVAERGNRWKLLALRYRVAANQKTATNLATALSRRHTPARVPDAKGSCNVLTPADLEARKRRFEQLTLGFMREISLIDEHDDPLLYLERLAYLKALNEALAGIETARVVLSQTLHRIHGKV